MRFFIIFFSNHNLLFKWMLIYLHGRLSGKMSRKSSFHDFARGNPQRIICGPVVAAVDILLILFDSKLYAHKIRQFDAVLATKHCAHGDVRGFFVPVFVQSRALCRDTPSGTCSISHYILNRRQEPSIYIYLYVSECA